MSQQSRRIVIWRHGQTAWNSQGRFQGQLDVPLNETGLAQAEPAAQMLATLRPEAIIASDLQRVADTAAALSRQTGIAIAVDKDLRERNFGQWQGLTREEIQKQYPQEWAAWQGGELIRPGGGELETEMAERVVSAIHRALATVSDTGTLVVVAHGGCARVAVGHLLGLNHIDWGALGGLSNCRWSVLSEGKRGWRLLEHNIGVFSDVSALQPMLSDDR